MVYALPLDYGGKLRILRTTFILAALHGTEACTVSDSSLCKLRSAFVSAAWSGRLSLANTGAVLTLLLDGPLGSDPAFHVVWCRFRMMRMCLGYNPGVLDLGRFYRLLGNVVVGAPGHGPVHLRVQSANVIGFAWDPAQCVLVRPGLPQFCHLASPCQFVKSAVWDAWSAKAAQDLSRRQGFRGGNFLDLKGSIRLLRASHVRNRDEGLLSGIMSGGVWNGFLLERVQGEVVPSRFCGQADGDGHLFWKCSYPSLVQIRENPEFHDLVQRDKSKWPWCLLWHGWLPALAYAAVRSPWAETAEDISHNRCEAAHGTYSGGAASCLRQFPNIWTDGSLISDELTGIASAGAGLFAHVSGSCWFHRAWGHLDLLLVDSDLGVERCSLYSSLPGLFFADCATG